MATHVAAPAALPTVVFPIPASWAALSAACGNEIPPIADRDDLVVTIAPGAGHGAPACFFPDLAKIEVDGSYLDGGVDPATAAPHRVGDRERYRTLWGLLVHECAHAAHSRWRAPDDTPPGITTAAYLLEESRIETVQVRRRPGDRYWLRASASNLILADTQANNPATGPTMTPDSAAQSAALLLARVDGGILNRRETAPVARIVKQVLGTKTLTALREIWRSAHTTADDDTETMLELGRRWCAALGTDPNTPPDGGDATEDEDGTTNTSGPPSPLAQAVNQTATAISKAVNTEPAPTDPATQAIEARDAEKQAQQSAQHTAAKVFSSNSPASQQWEIPTRGTRPPRDAERTAARQLARALTTAGTRERTTTKTTSATPPGRLRMRGALAADAQRAAGAMPTAEPFTRTTRAAVPTPPLRIGIACDVSGSMGTFTGPVASAAWILAHASRHTTVPTTTATVLFGLDCWPITHPGRTPRHITEFVARDSGHAIDSAIDSLDGALGLSRPDGARLLVVISDGIFEHRRRKPAQKLLDRLRANGCGVLWLAPDGSETQPMDGATVHTLTDPTTTARAIGNAATAALRATR